MTETRPLDSDTEVETVTSTDLRTDDLHKLVLYEPPIPVGDHELYSEEALAEMKRLLDEGKNEQVLVLFLREIAQSTPEEIEAQRSAPDWQDLVDAAHVWPRSVQAVGEYEFDSDLFDDMTTPTVLLTGSESPPFLKDATEQVNDVLPNSRILIFKGHAHEAMLTAPDRFIEEVLAFTLESNLGSTLLFRQPFDLHSARKYSRVSITAS